jgi:hypothetical protein
MDAILERASIARRTRNADGIPLRTRQNIWIHCASAQLARVLILAAALQKRESVSSGAWRRRTFEADA